MPLASVSWEQVVSYRLHKQHVVERTTPDRLVDVVREMVGIHSQVASSAELQLAARIDGLRPADIQDALASQRSIVKSWSMRGTLHHLVPDDLARIVVDVPRCTEVGKARSANCHWPSLSRK